LKGSGPAAPMHSSSSSPEPLFFFFSPFPKDLASYCLESVGMSKNARVEFSACYAVIYTLE